MRISRILNLGHATLATPYGLSFQPLAFQILFHLNFENIYPKYWYARVKTYTVYRKLTTTVCGNFGRFYC